MPRAKKDHSCLNIKIDAEIYRRLMEVSEEAGQTKTMVVERALQSLELLSPQGTEVAKWIVEMFARYLENK